VSLERILFELAGVATEPASDLPVAAVSRLADSGEPGGQAWWVRADPVHLRADRDQVLLYDFQPLDIAPEEAQGLAAEFNRFFADEGWHLDALSPTRWYLRLPEDPQIRTYDLAEVAGQPMGHFLPSGRRGQRWHSVLNEIQMLFHASEINQRRIQAGKPVINGVWLWGGGTLPSPPGRCTWQYVYSDEPVARGLARLQGVPDADRPASAQSVIETLPANGDTLIVVTSVQRAMQARDITAWFEALQDLDRNWLQPLVQQLTRDRDKQLELYPLDGHCYSMNRKGLRKWWRRRKAFSAWLPRQQQENVSEQASSDV
jgi:hypothetical protein